MTTAYRPSYAHLVDDDVWDRVTYQIQHSPEVCDLDADDPTELACRIFDQTIGFLMCCGTKTAEEDTFAATPHIDVGWHWFILHLGPYLAWCEQQFGRVVLHNPYHPVKDLTADSLREGRARTRAAMVRRGLDVDEAIWDLPYRGAVGDCDDACSYAY